MIKYMTTMEGITVDRIGDGFFNGWPNPPSRDAHLRILRQSEYVVLAVDEATLNIVGFVTAISDGVLCAYVPLLEVLPQYRHQGIGNQLVSKMFAQLSDYYMIDLSCDDNLQPFYEKHKMLPARAMIKRNYQRQAGI